MKEIRIDHNGAGKRMDKFLLRYLSGAPGSLIYAQLRKKNITLNHKKASGSEILSEEDTIQCFFSDETWEKFLHPGLKREDAADPSLAEAAACYAAHRGIRILYEDADLLIAEKPAGLLTQRAKSGDESLNDWLIGYLLETKKADPSSLAIFRPSAAHRLDRNTGGIVCMTLTLRSAQEIAKLLKGHRIGKYYLAVLHGRCSEPVRIRGFHDKNEQKNLVRISDLRVIREEELRSAGRVETKGDASAVGTEYGSLSETGLVPLLYDKDTDTTLVLAGLHTGKAHQLRAQFAAMGHPIVGDLKYGGAKTGNDKTRYRAAGQLLHASLLIFPESGLSLSAMTGKSFYSDPMGKGGAESETADGWHAFSSIYDVTERQLIEAVQDHKEVMGR